MCACVFYVWVLNFCSKSNVKKAFLWLRRKNVLINAKYILKLTHTVVHRENQNHRTSKLCMRRTYTHTHTRTHSAHSRTHTHHHEGTKKIQSHFEAHFNSIVEIFCT